MDRVRNYDIISQRFVTESYDIPFVETNCRNDSKYDVFIEVFDTDFTKSFFEYFNIFNLYAIYIVDEGDDSGYFNLNVISKYNNYGKDIVVVKAEFNFFMNIEYNNRTEVSIPYFFKSDNFEELKVEEVLNDALYWKEIVIGSFRKNIVKIDILKLLENVEIKSAIKFYTDRTEANIEDILRLKQDVLDVNAEYISKIEVSLNK